MPGLSQTTKTQAAFERLRLDIEEGVYEPGEWLRVNTLAEEYDVSATPIREALRLLQSDGLIEHVPHRGVRVAEFPAETVEEVYRLRAVLEPLATELATERATREQLGEIRRRHERLVEEVAQQGISPDLVELNEDFHWAIYSACGSHFLLEFLRRLWSTVPIRAGWLNRTAPLSVEQHEEIVQMMERGDGRGAAAAMRSHIGPMGRHLLDEEGDGGREETGDLIAAAD